MIMTIDPKSLQAIDDVSVVGDELLGEVISWESPSEISISKLREGLRIAGFDEAMARDMLPRNAFARAMHELEEGRVIRKIEDAGGILLFQFTKEYIDKQAKQVDYQIESMMRLDKSTGTVSCDLWSLGEQAQQLIDKQMGVRSASDVTAIVQRICRKQADLFPIRRQGGVYFVPERHSWIIGSLGLLMDAVGGNLIRFPVPAGSHVGRKSAGQAIKEEMHARIKDHMELIAGYTDKCPADALANRSQALVRIQGEIESYELLLSDLAGELKEHLDRAYKLLIAKMVEASGDGT